MWYGLAALGGYLVGSYGTLLMIRYCKPYRRHCKLRLFTPETP